MSPFSRTLTRRDWLKTTSQWIAATSLSSTFFSKVSWPKPPTQPKMRTSMPHFKTRVQRLNLKHTWTTTMAASDFRDTIVAEFNRDGITGLGEGAPIIRYHESALDAQKALDAISENLIHLNPLHFDKNLKEIFSKMDGQYAAKAALSSAIMDWVTQKMGIPLYQYFGLDPSDTPVTTFSIGIDSPEMTKQKVLEASDYPILKIKVGLDSDEATLAAVRSVTQKKLRVDANEGWKDKELAVKKINWLESQGVEFIEQPMPASMIEETKWVRSKVHIPIIADEACLRASSIKELSEAYDGINIKLDKAGGVLEAYKMIQIAKSMNMKTMLGCMVSSSLSVTAAAHLSPLVDYADLDGNLLISNDPFRGVKVVQGKLILPSTPGLGIAT